LDVEPEVELSEEERHMKEKRMNEIKKMIAIQSMQNLNIDETSATNNQAQQQNYNHQQQNSNYFDANYEKEKKAREQVGYVFLYGKLNLKIMI
jgi:hypothetical protein